jgi:hypothetical protein
MKKTPVEGSHNMKMYMKFLTGLLLLMLLNPTSADGVLLHKSTPSFEQNVAFSTTELKNEAKFTLKINKKRFPILSAIGLGFFGLTLIFSKIKKKSIKWIALSGFAAGTILGLIFEGLNVLSIINLAIWGALLIGLIVWALVRKSFNKRKVG